MGEVIFIRRYSNRQKDGRKVGSTVSHENAIDSALIFKRLKVERA
jgi:hypothetical protein